MPLSVCATPIGNLEDVTLRVLAELRAADVVLCEDTRRTRILLERHDVAVPLVSYHRHNEVAREQEVLDRLQRGQRVALVSDAGLPGVNDPGARLIRATLAVGVPVTVLPGPSAVETALVASGLVGERFQFVGYLPRRSSALLDLARELVRWPHAVVAFESPRRLPASLAQLARELPDRRAAVCRELTKRYEEVVRGTVAELADRFQGASRGEVTLVLGESAAKGTLPIDAEAVAAVSGLVAGGLGRRQAVDLVARLSGAPRRALYDASLQQLRNDR